VESTECHADPAFNGRGAAVEDVVAFERILDNQHLAYSTVSSPQLADMNEAALGAYRLLIVPRGSFETIGKHLTSNTLATIDGAEQGGLGYLGVCSGAILAGHNAYYDRVFDLASGAELDFYADTKRGVHKAAVAISGPGTVSIGRGERVEMAAGRDLQLRSGLSTLRLRPTAARRREYHPHYSLGRAGRGLRVVSTVRARLDR
jgi:hypothetical protein